MRSRLRADTALYATAVLLDRLLGFLMLPFLTRAITPQDYGVWTQTAVTAGLLVPLVVFAFPTAIVRYFSAAVGPGVRARFFDRLGATSLLLYITVATLALLGAGSFAAWAYGDTPVGPALVPPLLGLIAADAGIEFAVAWLRAAGRMGGVVVVLVLRSLLRYGALLALVGWAGLARRWPCGCRPMRCCNAA